MACAGPHVVKHLEVDDPVNRGLPSVVDVQVQWYAGPLFSFVVL